MKLTGRVLCCLGTASIGEERKHPKSGHSNNQYDLDSGSLLLTGLVCRLSDARGLLTQIFCDVLPPSQ